MRGAVFHHEVPSWHCSVLIELYIVNWLILPIVADAWELMVRVRVLGIL